MNRNADLENFINGIPKAELHLHIEGTFEPELMFEIAKRNNVKINYSTVDELKEAYNFNNLQEFLDLYYAGAAVLKTEEDFFEMTWAYLKKANSQNILHCEIFFDPQTHTQRGVEFSIVINGIYKACKKAEEIFGMSVKLIMCFLRDLDSASAMDALEQSLKYKDWIIAVGLDSAEVGNPPSKFAEVFEKARSYGYLTVAHAGEEGPAEYVWEALNILKVSRIDHGNRSIEDDNLMEELSQLGMPLTICPLSNLKLKVVEDLKEHPLKKKLDKGLLVTINSDDPAYFGGYINENYIELTKALELSKEEIVTIAKNSFRASFLEEQKKNEYIEKVNSYAKQFDL